MRLRSFFATACALVFAMMALFAVAWMKNPYGRGWSSGVKTECEYYLYSQSSQAKIVESVSLAESFFITGEKSVFCFDSEEEAGRYALNLLGGDEVTTVFEEEWDGVRSVYAYSARRGGGILLSGKRVNLHVVWKGTRVCVGTPIVFGGY